MIAESPLPSLWPGRVEVVLPGTTVCVGFSGIVDKKVIRLPQRHEVHETRADSDRPTPDMAGSRCTTFSAVDQRPCVGRTLNLLLPDTLFIETPKLGSLQVVQLAR